MTMLLSLQTIESSLTQFKTSRHIYIGYSGGVDSHVLLHLCAAITTLKEKIIAVYVHHGLQADSESWAGHCKKQRKAWVWILSCYGSMPLQLREKVLKKRPEMHDIAL